MGEGEEQEGHIRDMTNLGGLKIQTDLPLSYISLVFL